MKKTISTTNPVAPYIGGKRNLASTICPLINNHKHTLYAEPFVGMGGVFLRRTQQPRSEVINDYSGDVANLFRMLQRHYVAFMDMLKFQVTTRSGFERLIKIDPTTLTDLERAARFLYLQRTAFGGKVTGQNFGVSQDRGARFNVTTLGPMLEALHERLAGVVIECLDFEAFIKRYDRPNTLFYLDPPYWDCEGDYGKEAFCKADFKRLAGVLATLKGQFIMSLNDTEGVRKTFHKFHLKQVSTRYTVGGTSKAVEAAELLISSFDL